MKQMTAILEIVRKIFRDGRFLGKGDERLLEEARVALGVERPGAKELEALAKKFWEAAARVTEAATCGKYSERYSEFARGEALWGYSEVLSAFAGDGSRWGMAGQYFRSAKENRLEAIPSELDTGRLELLSAIAGEDEKDPYENPLTTLCEKAKWLLGEEKN